jgi:hypothetical protein
MLPFQFLYIYKKRKFIFLGRLTIKGTIIEVCCVSKRAHLGLKALYQYLKKLPYWHVSSHVNSQDVLQMTRLHWALKVAGRGKTLSGGWNRGESHRWLSCLRWLGQLR